MITVEKDGVKFTFENVADLEKCLKIIEKAKLTVEIKHVYDYPHWVYTYPTTSPTITITPHEVRPWVTYTTCSTVTQPGDGNNRYE